MPLTQTETMNAVWFTTAATPNGHGVYGDRELTDAERQALTRITGRPAPPGIRMVDKTAVRIRVQLLMSDRNLKPWLKFARSRNLAGMAEIFTPWQSARNVVAVFWSRVAATL